MTEPCHVCGAKDHEPYCSVEPSWRGRIASLEAENRTLRNAVVTATERAETAERQLAEVGRAGVMLKLWAGKAHAHWDVDEDAKAGKIMMALAGYIPGYSAEIDAAHAALAPAEKPVSDGPDTDYDPSRDM